MGLTRALYQRCTPLTCTTAWVVCLLCPFRNKRERPVPAAPTDGSYRFATVFAPHLMAALLVMKLLVPYVLVCCCFAGVTDATGSNRTFTLGLSAVTAVWAAVFLTLVKSHGSWKDIGNSVSHFLVAAATSMLVPALTAVGHCLVGRRAAKAE